MNKSIAFTGYINSVSGRALSSGEEISNVSFVRKCGHNFKSV